MELLQSYRNSDEASQLAFQEVFEWPQVQSGLEEQKKCHECDDETDTDHSSDRQPSQPWMSSQWASPSVTGCLKQAGGCAGV